MKKLRNLYKIKITGDKDKVEKSSFEKIVLDFIKEQKEFNKEQKEFNQKVDQRLSIIEDKLNTIESLPTIKRELNNLK